MSETAERTYWAVQALAAELPALVGADDWPALAAHLAALDAEWAAADATHRVGVAAAYRTALARYPAARAQLAAAQRKLTFVDAALAAAAALALQLGDTAGAARLRQASLVAESRLIALRPVGEPARSVKWANLQFDFGKLTLAAAAILAAVATATDPTTSGLSLAAAVLLILGELYKALEREISVDDASVFWGLVQAGGEAKQADVAAVLAAANAARAAAPLEPLTEPALRVSLGSLGRLQAIACVDEARGIWRVVEDHGVGG